MLETGVVRHLRYLNKYRKYQRFDTSIEEVSIYHNAMIPPNIVMILCSLQLNRSIVDSYCTLHDSNEKACHIKLVKHIVHIYFNRQQVLSPTSWGTGKLYPLSTGLWTNI